MSGQNFHPDKEKLKQAVSALTEKKVLIIGDVMLDEYLVGDTERISPEAPVPVVLVTEDRQVLGGAGNVARNIRALSGQPCLVGMRGRDTPGEALEACLKKEGIQAELYLSQSRPTTVKTRVLARQQQVLRIDREHSLPLNQGEVNSLLALVEKHLPGSSAVVISDYGKGLICQELMDGLTSLLKGFGADIPVLVDPKPQNIDLYKGVTLLTPNTKETGESAGLPVRNEAEIATAGRALLERLQSKHLLTTLGSQGMAIFSAGEIRHIPTMARSVFDVTGAGDTVIATVALALAAGLPLLGACMLANYAAGIVVGQVGAATARQEDLLQAIEALPLPEIRRWA